MKAILVETNKITLPESILKKIKGKKINIISTKEGVLLKPVEDTIRSAKGLLKGSRFSTSKYFQFKQEEKKLEG
jgi:hypothetical protein